MAKATGWEQPWVIQQGSLEEEVIPVMVMDHSLVTVQEDTPALDVVLGLQVASSCHRERGPMGTALVLLAILELVFLTVMEQVLGLVDIHRELERESKLVSNGYGSDVYGTADGYGGGPVYPSALADNIGLNGAAGFGAGGLGGPGMIVNPGLGTDAKSRKYGAGGVLGAAGSLPYGGQPVVSAGLGPQGKTGGYGGTTYGGIPTLGPDAGLGGTGGAMEPLAGGAVGQNPYGAPVIAAGIDVDAGYPFGAEQLSLGADVRKTAAKYGTGYAAALSNGGQGSYGGQKDGSKLSGIYGNGYKG
ncbi:unnamed protein product [Leuciscus chuanchicus]